jgi:hypothetical protein
MKQTAVEWLKNELESFGTSKKLKLDWLVFDELMQQAKEMEKELIIETFKYAQTLHAMGDETRAEQYYKKTYGGNK